MMMSRLFANNQRLNDCEVKDASHVTPNDRGEHVKLIQQALFIIERADIIDAEVTSSTYGDSTAAAVLAYKTRRNIVNRSYQSKPDSIVGKMTIRRLDDDMLQEEARDASPGAAQALRPLFGRLT